MKVLIYCIVLLWNVSGDCVIDMIMVLSKFE